MSYLHLLRYIQYYTLQHKKETHNQHFLVLATVQLLRYHLAIYKKETHNQHCLVLTTSPMIQHLLRYRQFTPCNKYLNSNTISIAHLLRYSQYYTLQYIHEQELKGTVQRDLMGSNVTSFDRFRFKDVLLGLFLKFYSAAILYFSQIRLADYNTKKVPFFSLFGFL